MNGGWNLLRLALSTPGLVLAALQKILAALTGYAWSGCPRGMGFTARRVRSRHAAHVPSGPALAAGFAWINSIGISRVFGPWYVGVMKDAPPRAACSAALLSWSPPLCAPLPAHPQPRCAAQRAAAARRNSSMRLLIDNAIVWTAGGGPFRPRS